MPIMCSVILLALVVQAQGGELAANPTGNAQDSTNELIDKVAHKLLDKIFDRALRTLLLHQPDIDEISLSKPGHLTLSSRGGVSSLLPRPSSLLPPPRAQPISDDSPSPPKIYQPQFLEKATLYPSRSQVMRDMASVAMTAALVNPLQAIAGEAQGNFKIAQGAASTSDGGSRKTITRGAILDGSDFGGKDLGGVSFQQSIVRDTNFKGTNLKGASFFDATVDGSDFTDADLTGANLEATQFKRAILKNAVIQEAYTVGATGFKGVETIENSDWTDAVLRKDQIQYLCSLETCRGTNPKTGVDTRESLNCP